MPSRGCRQERRPQAHTLFQHVQQRCLRAQVPLAFCEGPCFFTPRNTGNLGHSRTSKPRFECLFWNKCETSITEAWRKLTGSREAQNWSEKGECFLLPVPLTRNATEAWSRGGLPRPPRPCMGLRAARCAARSWRFEEVPGTSRPKLLPCLFAGERGQQRCHAATRVSHVSCSRHKPSRASPCGCEQVSQPLLSTSQQVAGHPRQIQHTELSSPKEGCLSLAFLSEGGESLKACFQADIALPPLFRIFLKCQQPGQFLFMELPAALLLM